MDDKRWIPSGDGSWPEMDRDWIWMADRRRWMTGDGSQETDHGRRMTINLLSYMKLRSCNRAQNCRHTMYRRHGSTEYDTEHYSEMPNYAATCPSYNAGIATTPTAKNYRTGSAGTKHRETHSPIEKAGSGKCTWRRSNNCTPRTAKSARKEVMANAPTDESRSRMAMLQSRMRSHFSLGDPNSVSTIPRYTAATGKEEAVMD